jgi:DNA-binding LacI/PurR family transcriptional regulator
VTPRITINDIARAAGYSKTAVSFAFNDPSRISHVARGKILRAAEELGYVPDPVARNLSRRTLGTIGFLIPEIIPLAFQNPYVFQMMIGIGEVCRREGLSLTVVPPRRGCVLSAVRDAAVDGLVTMGLQPEAQVVQLIQRRKLPFVVLDGVAPDGVPSIVSNDEEVSFQAMRHVLARGHRRVAVLSFADERHENEEAYSGIRDIRLAGYFRALDEAGVRRRDVSVIPALPSLDGGRAGMDALLQLDTCPTAVVSMSDVAAIGAMSRLQSLGYEIPQTMSFVGFDDIPEAVIIAPKLTTVAQPGYEKGVRAGELLTALMHGKSTPDRV